ncbi:MAG: hypothetical protein LBH91_08710 [Prevotellaceae bacterium]|nr:hypothetical protein [Prevotellaceae bacterium]
MVVLLERHSIYKITLTAILLVALFTGLPKNALAQKQESMEGEFGIYYNVYDGYYTTSDGEKHKERLCEGRAWYLQFIYTWWLNKYIGCSAGGMFIKGSKISSSWTDGDKYYSFDDSPFHINAVGEFRVALPLVWKFGLTLNVRLMFSPIPIDVISYSVYQGMGKINHTTEDFPYATRHKISDKSHYLFTRFNLGGIVNAGLYFDIRGKDRGARITLGYGIGSYDIYNSVRLAKTDGHSLAEHIPSSRRRYIHNVFICLTVF